MIYLSYSEEFATLTVILEEESPGLFRRKKYTYKDVPFCIFNQCSALVGKNAIGKFWKVIRKYDLVN